MTLPAPLPNPANLSITAYAFAHFGKSLWWNGSELFLAFYLTEHLNLTPLAAGMAISTGLLTGAGFDLLIGSHLSRFASVRGAGRLQLVGATASAFALLLLGWAFVVSHDARLPLVVGANVIFRLAYALYDLPQNSLLSLTPWTPIQRRTVAAARTAAGAGALLIMSVLVSIDRPWSAGITHIVFAFSASAIAVTSAGWLWWESRRTPKKHAEMTRENKKNVVLRWPLVLMALVCLTSPAFSKLAPYVATYSPVPRTYMPLVLIATATVASQPGWVALLRRLDDVRAGIVAGIIMSVAGLLINQLWLAALLVGVASGGFGTVIWSGYAIAVADLGPLAAAPAFAKLTAIAKMALAVAALAIAGILTATDYRSDGAALLPLMQVLTLAGGIVTAGYLGVAGLLRPGKHAG